MERTLGDIHRAAKYQVSAHLRTIARSEYTKANLPRVCANCGYAKHVEICHVKAINSFSEETPVAVINDLTNLVALCPNCHWELDHGLLVL
ncbi:MAG: HNH endonuclease [Chloroflexota bacterium]